MGVAIREPQARACPVAARRPLGLDSRLRFDAAACLPARYPGCACGVCVSACPVGAIELEAGAPVASGEACIGCGQCVAACPTAALEVDGFALPSELPVGPGALFIDCWRVPPAESPEGAWRVPCLGGLDAGWLLALFDRLDERGARPIRLLDRGACQNCPAGGGIENFHAALDEVRELLSACGVDPAVLPASTFQAARQALAPSIPTAASAVPIERRQFFRSLLGGAARTLDAANAAVAVPADEPLRREILPLANLRIATALDNIARRRGRSAPPRALPQLSVADCAAHGVCARVCPTGALQRSEAANGSSAELRFRAALCIGCGQCVRVCPDGALRLTPEGGRAGSETLVRWTAQNCVVCGEAFFGRPGDTCPACEKRQQLLQGVAALFAPRVC